ncbi:MAG: hypothetical protein M1813_003029 [Trichoglossum hirsutum]|nr:MAG: hypothetical protein M1813_003029 [Trichoglossum hirsutum]
MGNEQSREQRQVDGHGVNLISPTQSELARVSDPVPVPLSAAASSDRSSRYESSPIEPSAPPQISSDLQRLPPSQTHRPPRLPLPIEEEVHTPGSPIISPTDLIPLALESDSIEGVLPRRTSVLSSTTVDEDEVVDDLGQYSIYGGVRKTIPTPIEWKQGGNKVYVTGTFTGWNRKFRLHKSASKDGLSAIIQLPPGTHHIKFIVDGEMRTSDDLPTAVDYANILVNYLEVSADDIPPDGPSKPVNVLDSGHAGVHSSHAVTPAPGSKSKEQDADASKEKLQSAKPSAQAPPAPPRRYTKEIPKYLLDYDQPEDSPEYLRSAAAISNLPLPPSLPMFLSKVILNGTTPMKDDSSVLNIPNHVVLNHLATSSIKYNVLAVSATTRYKRKYVTTILYKETNENE